LSALAWAKQVAAQRPEYLLPRDKFGATFQWPQTRQTGRQTDWQRDRQTVWRAEREHRSAGLMRGQTGGGKLRSEGALFLVCRQTKFHIFLSLFLCYLAHFYPKGRPEGSHLSVFIGPADLGPPQRCARGGESQAASSCNSVARQCRLFEPAED